MNNMRLSREAVIASGANTREKDYWLEKLAGVSEITRFPPDFPGTRARDVKTGEYKDTRFKWEGGLFDSLMKLGNRSDHALHVILTAAVEILLHAFTGNTPVVTVTPIYKQDYPQQLINTFLAVRFDASPGMTFKDGLIQVKQTVLDAVENQSYLVELLLDKLDIPQPGGGEFPFADSGVMIENIHDRSHLEHYTYNLLFIFSRTGNAVEGKVEYNPVLYREESVQGFTRLLRQLLVIVTGNVDILVESIDLLTEAEKRQIIDEFNGTAREYPRDSSIDDLFSAQAARTPGRVAVFGETVQLTYGELDRLSGRLAGCLQANGAVPGGIIAVMLERDIHMAIAVLAVLKAGCAYMPVSPYYPEQRRSYMLKDSGSRIVITSSRRMEHTGGVLPGTAVIDMDDPGIFNGSGNGSEPVDRSPVPNGNNGNNGNSLAYIMYTSGSTGIPKGVMVEHMNVSRLVVNTGYIDFLETDRILQTGALEFDASTFEIWGALLNGLSLCLVGREKILAPAELKNVVRRFDITVMWMTAPLFNQVIQAEPGVFEGLRVLLAGGDVLSPVHINTLLQHYPGLVVINGYGPTENTTFSTTYRVTRQYREAIPIGRPIANSTAYIVDRYGRLSPVGVPGELITGGDGIARGYLNNPELTADRFMVGDLHGLLGHGRHGKPRIFTEGFVQKKEDQSASFINHQSSIINFYRTGDMARWLADGNIEFLGRKDHQVKIRGFRIELEEIENRLLRHPGVSDAVVTVRTDDTGDKLLCAYYVARDQGDGQPGPGDLAEFISSALPDYMVPAFFTRLGSIPLTANGKVDTKALPEPGPGSSAKDYTAPRDDIEKRLVKLWGEILNLDPGVIGINENFFDIGGHSLRAIRLISRIHKEFNVLIPLEDVFQMAVASDMAQFIKQGTRRDYEEITPAEKREYYPLSPAQKRLYVLYRVTPGSVNYNMPLLVKMEGEIEKSKLEHAFRQLIERHESLRTLFIDVNYEPVQTVYDHVDFQIRYDHIPGPFDQAVIDEKVNAFVRPFDLGQLPYLRVGLIEIGSGDEPGSGEHVLLVDMHHVISDGMSHEIILREILALYNDVELPPVKLHYKDFSQWINDRVASGKILEQEAFWLEQFSGDIPRAKLPYDFPRPEHRTFDGATMRFYFPVEQVAQLKAIASGHNSTLFMVLLSLFYILMAKICRQDDIVVGSIVAGRRQPELEQVIGMFVNTLALRGNPASEKTFTGFLDEVKKRTLQAFDNQDYQFDELVEKLDIERIPGQNPLFDVLFSFNTAETKSLQEEVKESGQSGLEMKPFGGGKTQVKFDLMLAAGEMGQHLFLAIQYSTELFNTETIQRFTRYFGEIVEAVTRDEAVVIKDIAVSHDLAKAASDVYHQQESDFDF